LLTLKDLANEAIILPFLLLSYIQILSSLVDLLMKKLHL